MADSESYGFTALRPGKTAPEAPISRAPQFGIYVHTPFCVHRCSYCDFFSLTRYADGEMDHVTARLVDEIDQARLWLDRQGRSPLPAVSLFFGGGTPSLLPMPLLSRLFRRLVEAFALRADAEVTLEANPETVNDAFVAALVRETPVNRVSLGAQSFQPRFLQALERLGSPESIREAAACLRRNGIERFNLDLIFGIPGQSLHDVLADIDAAAAIAPSHISFYSLTLKPGHPLYAKLPTDDEAADLYEAGIERLAEHGYAQYEISNFSRPGQESRHNLLYWSGGDFLGLGPSASSRFFWDGAFHHRRQLADLQGYLKAPPFPAPGFEATTPQQTVLEAIFLELRKNAGVRLDDFSQRYRYDISTAKRFAAFCEGGLLQRQGDVVKLTDRGRLLADAVCRDLADPV